jgi:hypothetical protein
MDGKQFDQVIKRLGAGATRRRMLGGVIGTSAALLAGATVLEAKRGGQGRGRGRGRGKGTTKLSYCHQNGNGSYRFVTVGAPSAHSRHEGDIPCTPTAECQVATGCDETTGTCTFETAPEGTPCDVDPTIEEACDADGACVPVVP